jgi:hypothetical protein
LKIGAPSYQKALVWGPVGRYKVLLYSNANYSLFVGGGLTYFVGNFLILIFTGSYAISLQKPSRNNKTLNEIFFGKLANLIFCKGLNRNLTLNQLQSSYIFSLSTISKFILFFKGALFIFVNIFQI